MRFVAPVAFPFAAVAGLELSKQALLLLAVDHGLKGVLIAGAVGTAKSLLVRAFPALLAAGEGRPFVDVPIGVTEDRLLGGLNLERTVLTGRRHFDPGLLAAADGGFLVIDEIHRLERSAAVTVAGALNYGRVRVEKDGISAAFSADFAVIGTYDPAEGEPAAALADAVGMHVRETGWLSPHDWTQLLTDLAIFDRDAPGLSRQYAAATTALRLRVAAARKRLPAVESGPADWRRLSEAALALGLEGHRGEIFAVRAALAHAALAGRARIERPDLEAAVHLVLLPRSLAIDAGHPSPMPEQPDLSEAASAHDLESSSPGGRRSSNERLGDLVIAAALDGTVNPELLSRLRANCHGFDRGRGAGCPATASPSRGRYVGAVAAGRGNRKVALEATLRAAAPYQIQRRNTSSGRPPQTAMIRASDLRFKQFRQNAGILVIFAVDASGSMALHRIGQAKGALMRLLRQAYLNRDKVALISFRGNRAELVLAPTRATERAGRAVEGLLVGGGTPLAAGLRTALHLASHSKDFDIRRALLVLLTDGRPNVASCVGPIASRQTVWRELEQVCAALRLKGMASVIIDTNHRALSGGEGARLAHMLGGRYVYLPRPDASSVYQAVAAAVEAERR